MGERIVDLVGEGDVALFIATPGSPNLQPRIEGATRSIKSSGKGSRSTRVATGAACRRSSRRSKRTTWATSDVKGMYAVDGGSTEGVAQVMQKYEPGHRASRPAAST